MERTNERLAGWRAPFDDLLPLVFRYEWLARFQHVILCEQFNPMTPRRRTKRREGGNIHNVLLDVVQEDFGVRGS